MANIKDFHDPLKFPKLEPDLSIADEAIKSIQESNSQKERQSFFRFFFPFLVSLLALFVAVYAAYLSSKMSISKEKSLQQANTIQELSAKIISLEGRIKELESNLTKKNRMLAK